MSQRNTKTSLLLIACLALGFLPAEVAKAMVPVIEVLKVEHFAEANLLRNGGFEEVENGVAAHWGAYESGCSVAAGAGRSGGAAIYCHNEGTTARSGARQTLVLDQKTPAPLLVRGWSRARNVDGSKSSDYSVYVDLLYEDGTPLWGQTADFNTGTHDWESQEVIIIPAKPVKSLTVYALFRRMGGEVWFDDLEVRDMAAGAPGLLDMTPVKVAEPQPATAPEERMPLLEASTSDGLTIKYDWQAGRVASLNLDGAELAMPGAPSGFLVRDVAAGSDFFAFENGQCAALGLKINATLQADARSVRVSGRILDQRQEDRAVTLLFALPVDGRGWQWHDDVRHSREIEPNQEYFNVANIGTGANGKMSVYPMGCMTGGGHGLALALDMGLPGQYRIGYSSSTRHLFIAYDFGLSPDTDNFPCAVPFSFVIYRSDPQWGFRAALNKLYEIFPDYFLCRSKQQGIWMPFTDVSTVGGWQDFGFRYHEGINNVPFDDSADILSFRYTEPSTWWFRIDPQIPRTRENVMKLLQEAAQSDNAHRRRNAEAALVSGSHDAYGQLQYLVRNAPWTNGAVFSLNPDPRIPGNSEAKMNWNDAVKRRLYGPEAAGQQDGEYLDSLEAYVTANENFRRDHFHYVTVPLTFATSSKSPVIHKAFSQYEFTKWIAEDVHGMGKLMFANGVPSRFTFLCPWLDIMGSEMDWLDGEGRWRPPSDQVMNLKRTMCYRKPYLLLMNTNYDRLTPDLVEKYFQRSLFYGIWPSMFSHNASDDPYWRNPNWYNRDRHLFKRYIPLVRLVAEAGWEPITHAWTDNDEVYVERFGPSGGGEAYFTLLNSSSQSQEAVLTIAAGELALGTPGTARDLIADEALLVVAEGRTVRVTVPMAPEQVRMISLPVKRRTR